MKGSLSLSIIFLILLVAGCAGREPNQAPFGLKTVQGCDSDQSLTRDSEIMQCYRAAAITSAYANDRTDANRNGAMDICEDIWLKFGENSDTDMQERAAESMNSCYTSIASILKDEEICYYVEKKSSLNTQLVGADVSQDICVQEVRRLAKLQDYYNDAGNICGMMFIFPLMLIGGFLSRLRH